MSGKSLVPTSFNAKMVVFDAAHETATGGSFAAFFDAAQGTNYDLLFDVTMPHDNGHSWLTYRHYDQNNKYLINLTSGKAQFQVMKGSGTPAHTSPEVPFPFKAGAEVHMFLQMRGFTFSFGVQGQPPALVWTDPSSAFASGPTVGLYSSGSDSISRWCDVSGTPLP